MRVSRTILLAMLVLMGACAGRRLLVPTEREAVLLPSVSVLLMGSVAESLAAEEILHQMGIPHFTTRMAEEAVEASMMLISFDYVAAVNNDLRKELEAYVASGGVVIAQKAKDATLGELFGFEQAVLSRNRHEMVWQDLQHPLTKYIDAPEEKVARLAMHERDELFLTVGYVPDEATVLARFEDGLAALTERRYGTGRAITIGGSLTDLVLRTYLDKDYGVHKQGSNAFETSTDTYLLLIRAAYEEFVSDGLRISTVPPGKRGSLILSHDIDAQKSFPHMLDFARAEERAGVHSTLFVQTRYLTDYYDVPFMTDENLDILRQLHTDGFELASHSVSHTPHLPELPMGEWVTDPEDYSPRIVNMEETLWATVRGEVLVSKSLLDRNVADQVVSFRTGHLMFNRNLVEALEEAGYLYDSSVGTYDCGCNFPYRHHRRRSFSEPSNILEIPMTISDHKLGDDDLRGRIPKFRELILKNLDNGAPTTLLIHPTRTADKLDTIEQLLAWLPDDMWVGTIASFGAFWNSRYDLKSRIEIVNDTYIYTFTASNPTRPLSLVLNSLPDSIWVTPGMDIVNNTTVVIPALEPGDTLHLRVRFPLSHRRSQPR